MIGDELSMSNTIQNDLLKFVELHCHLKKYLFQIKKRSDTTCQPPSRLPREVFSNLKWLPDPTLTSDKANCMDTKETYQTILNLCVFIEY